LVAALLGAAVVVPVISACGSSGPRVSDCDRAAQAAPAANAGTVVLVVDNTASSAGRSLPPAIGKALVSAQKAGQRLEVVPVDGAGHPTGVKKVVALDPAPGKQSTTADNARRITVGCVASWSQAADMRPTRPGSAILDALAAAARERPDQILVVSDGLSNSGEFDLNQTGFDAAPAELAGALRTAGSIAPELAGRKILWAGLGESAPPLRQTLRTSLQGMWTAVLGTAGATVGFDAATGNAATARKNLPADDVKLPDVKQVSVGCGTEWTVPASLLFGPDSAQLQPGADEPLRAVAATIAGDQQLVATVSGHSANYGSPGEQVALSKERAEAVATALVGLGIGAARITTNGYGAARPAVAEFRGGVHDAAAAAQNRRVVISVGPRGCAQ
jgi:outer membrane protein OmpA-like peptidoglycan-associated protein